MVGRYSKSRKKACQACASTKSKCDRNPVGCGRCTSRQLTCTYPEKEGLVPRPHDAPILDDSGFQTDSLVSDLFTTVDTSTREVALTPQVIDSGIASIASVHGFSDDSNICYSADTTYRTFDHVLELDFSNLELICPIDAESIKNRWLNCYVPIPGQVHKTFPPNVAIFVHNILKSYAGSTVRGRTLPPFLHPTQTSKTFICPVLSRCLSLVRLCDSPLPGSEKIALEILRREMDDLYEGLSGQNDMNLLAIFQAYLIYCMALYFNLGAESNPSLQQDMMNLQDIACFCSSKGLVCLAEQRGIRPKWEAWLLTEAKRRTLYTMYLFDNMLSIKDGLPTFLATEVRGLAAAASKTLWEARTREIWEKAYNIHLADWTDGYFHIDELWPMSDMTDELVKSKRRSRLERWLENIDEFGTMMYAVTSCVHGQ